MRTVRDMTETRPQEGGREEGDGYTWLTRNAHGCAQALGKGWKESDHFGPVVASTRLDYYGNREDCVYCQSCRMSYREG